MLDFAYAVQMGVGTVQSGPKPEQWIREIGFPNELHTPCGRGRLTAGWKG